MTPEAIMVRCEGTDCPTHRSVYLAFGICSMCGAHVVRRADNTAVEHQRRDLLAMLERGDFDE